MTTKTHKILLLGIIAVMVAALVSLAGCGSSQTAKAESTNNTVTVTLSGTDGDTAYGNIKTEEGEALKLKSNVTDGTVTVIVKSPYTDIYTSRELSGDQEIGIAITAAGSLTVKVTGNNKAKGTLSFEVVPEADIEGMDTGEEGWEAPEESADDASTEDTANANSNESASSASAANTNDNANASNDNSNAANEHANENSSEASSSAE